MDVHSPKNGINRYWSIPMWVLSRFCPLASAAFGVDLLACDASFFNFVKLHPSALHELIARISPVTVSTGCGAGCCVFRTLELSGNVRKVSQSLLLSFNFTWCSLEIIGSCTLLYIEWWLARPQHHSEPFWAILNHQGPLPCRRRRMARPQRWSKALAPGGRCDL